jgi:hypothetical protein
VISPLLFFKKYNYENIVNIPDVILFNRVGIVFIFKGSGYQFELVCLYNIKEIPQN